ncbi:MAG: hypothetical protein OEM39_09865 [Acidimicrobiia bacterium]|nr:hypothetical protein [Acidimicrobiia bacterium]MDH3463070.1 hypothetical protein [Acidimicrobiia bacterium]
MSKEKPFVGLIFGLIFGLAVAVLLQQAGVWPLDKLTVYLVPGLVALLFVFLARIGRKSVPSALTVVLVILIAPIAYGLTGIGEFDESGQLNGGCTVDAATDLDTTIVTDTKRSEAFRVDPDGGLTWFATSPVPITDHEWEIWVVIGNFEYVVADGGSANTDLDQDNFGDEPSVRGYVEDLGIRSGDQIRGVYEVGGFIEGSSGCDGFGFVVIEGGFLETLISKTALAVALLALIIFLWIILTGRETGLIAEPIDPDRIASLGGATGGVAAAGLADAPGPSDDEDNKDEPGPERSDF